MSRKQKRLTKSQLLDRCAVKAAISRRRIENHVRRVQLEIYFQELNQDATLCLAHLGWLVSLAAEVEHAALGLTQRLRVIHGAARQVHAMCLAGYHWTAPVGTGLDHAVSLAHEALMANPYLVANFISGADEFAQAIHDHKVTADQIAGVEIYADREAA